MGPSAAGTPITDFGRKSPLIDLEPFFIPWPILRSMMDADEAAEATDRLSVEPMPP